MSVSRWESPQGKILAALAKKGIKVYQSNEQPKRGKALAIYGPRGVGKTTIAGQCADYPELCPVGYVNADGGAWVFSYRDDITILDVTSWDDYEEILARIVGAPEPPFKTLIIDSKSNTQALSIFAQCGYDKPIEQRHWGVSTAKVLNTTKMLEKWAKDRATNVIFVLKQDTFTLEKDGPVHEEVGFTKSLREDWPYILDIIGHMQFSGSTKRMLDFNATDLNSSKFRRAKDEVALRVPLRFTFTEQDRPIADLLMVLNEGREWPKSYKQADLPPDMPKPPSQANGQGQTQPSESNTVETEVDKLRAQATEGEYHS